MDIEWMLSLQAEEMVELCLAMSQDELGEVVNQLAGVLATARGSKEFRLLAAVNRLRPRIAQLGQPC
jgi:hypothetical protein